MKNQLVDLLLVFSNFLSFPEKDLYENIKSEEILNDFSIKLYSVTNCSNEIPPFQGTFKDLITEYRSVMEIEARPIESLYKVWTNDSTCMMPFARSKGYLYGDSALHVQYLLSEFNIELPHEKKYTPDHLLILMELLIYFIENTEEIFVERFIAEHFDWLSEWNMKVSNIAPNSFYANVSNQLCTFIQSLEKNKKELIYF